MTTTIWHGAYAEDSKYEIVQHRYGCTDCEADIQGFAEVLEIRNPPAPRGNAVVHIFWNGKGSTYFEFAHPVDAIAAYVALLRLFNPNMMQEASGAAAKQAGYLCAGHTTQLKPWFYETE